MDLFTRKICIILFVFFLIVCSSSSDYDLRAEDKPKHHTENGFRNYPLIEPADTQGFKFIWNRIFSSSKPDKIPADHLICRKGPLIDIKIMNEDTITWIGQSTALLKINGKVILTDPFFSKRAGPGILGPSSICPPGISAKYLPAVDIIVISHNHYDHLDADLLIFRIKRVLKLLCPWELESFLGAKIILGFMSLIGTKLQR